MEKERKNRNTEDVVSATKKVEPEPGVAPTAGPILELEKDVPPKPVVFFSPWAEDKTKVLGTSRNDHVKNTATHHGPGEGIPEGLDRDPQGDNTGFGDVQSQVTGPPKVVEEGDGREQVAELPENHANVVRKGPWHTSGNLVCEQAQEGIDADGEDQG